MFSKQKSEVNQYELMPTTSRLSLASQQQTWTQRQLKGWRFGILCGAILAFFVFGVNLSFTIYGGITSETEDATRKLLYSGNCEEVTKMSIGIHLLINLLSTLLLSASNYGMQCLSAPTRPEVDAAHAKKIWLDIGVLSVKNLSKISGKRRFLWVMLGLSSFPLHLFYNSAVYSSVYAYDFDIFQTTEAVLKNPDPTVFVNQTSSSYRGYDRTENVTAMYMYASFQENNLTRLENQDCIDAYSSSLFQTSRGNLILVAADNTTQTVSLGLSNSDMDSVSSSCTPDPFGWMCGRTGTQLCDPDEATCTRKSVNVADWNPFGGQIQYCLSEQVPQKCEIQFVPWLAYSVVCFNLIKASILLYTFFLIKENPLMTIGDAASSFLRYKDETTSGLCLMSKQDIDWWAKNLVGYNSKLIARPLKVQPQKWSSVASRRRWIFMALMYVAIMAICLGLFFFGLYASGFGPHTLLRLGIGAVDPRTFIQWSIPSSGTKALFSNVFIANAPQPILSMIYYTYNGLLTCFLLGLEWNSFARNRKGLRVTSSPRGYQRSSYTLQLPKKWAFPLMGLSALLHWLVSQSIFIVSIQFDENYSPVSRVNMVQNIAYNSASADGSVEYLTCAYSPSAILCTIILGVLMLVFVVGIGQVRYKSPEMPVVGSCSAAISAACHLQAQDQLPTKSALSSGNPSANLASPFVSPYYDHLNMARPNSETLHSSFNSFSSPSYFSPYHAVSPDDIDSATLLSAPASMGASVLYSGERARQSIHSTFSYDTGYDTAYTGAIDMREGPEIGSESAYETVQWGASGEAANTTGVEWVDESGVPVKRRVHHCGLSARKIDRPVEGELYAGL
jgi:hypothetical protein